MKEWFLRQKMDKSKYANMKKLMLLHITNLTYED
jgi:hypothetical protein